MYLALIILILVFLFFSYDFAPSFVDTTIQDPRKNGFIVFDAFSENEVNTLLELSKLQKYSQVKKYIQENVTILKQIDYSLGHDFIFQNYMLVMGNTSISSCHQEEDFHKTYPSYTLIMYLEPTKKCLNVVKGSHKGNSIDEVLKTIKCKPGQAILFDAHLVHSGVYQDTQNNLKIQMKIAHRDDIYKSSSKKDHSEKLFSLTDTIASIFQENTVKISTEDK